MSIKVTFPNNQRIATQNGLYQWDYGQELEIESDELGSEIVEVHFASQNMSEAIVRSCSFVNGVGIVTVPDLCLEQASPVTAWVYLIDGTTGHTWGTINLPINKRTKPSMSREIPQEVSNRYTELITEVNRTVGALESGDVKAALAENAEKSDYATSAGSATSATYAASAGSASAAGSAKILSIDKEYSPWSSFNGGGGLIAFKITDTEVSDSALIVVDVCGNGRSQSFRISDGECFLEFVEGANGEPNLNLVCRSGDGTKTPAPVTYSIEYKRLSAPYAIG